jgi:hypothetical protein
MEKNSIRAFYPDKNKLSNEGLKNIKVKRFDRKSSLDIPNVQLGSTRDQDKKTIGKKSPRENRVDPRKIGNKKEVILEDKSIHRDKKISYNPGPDLKDPLMSK